MLNKSQLTLLLITIIKSTQIFADVYVQTPDLENISYQKMVSTVNGNSLIEYINSSYSIQKNFKYSNGKSVNEIETQIQKIISQPLLKGDVEIIIGLYQKIYQQRKNIPLVRVYSYFKTHPDLQDYYPNFWNKIKSKTPERNYIPQIQIQRLMESLLPEENIYVDGKLLIRDEIKKVINIKRQWLFVSNKRKSLFHNGSIEEFIRLIQVTGFYTGTCLSEQNIFNQELDLKVSLLTQEPQCLQFLPQTDYMRTSIKHQSYYEKNKGWIIPVTIGVGVLALNYLKDKKITFQIPSIQF